MKRPISSGHVGLPDGQTVLVDVAQTYPDDDPAVVHAPGLFVDAEPPAPRKRGAKDGD